MTQKMSLVTHKVHPLSYMSFLHATLQRTYLSLSVYQFILPFLPEEVNTVMASHLSDSHNHMFHFFVILHQSLIIHIFFIGFTSALNISGTESMSQSVAH